MNPKKLVRKVLPKNGIKLAEESYRRGRLTLLQARYGFPARSARVIAITGTNGKTTTATLTNELLKAAGHRTALFSTAAVEIAGNLKPNTTHRTVPLTADLLKFFQTAKQKRVDFVILEATSQALHQHKLQGLNIEVAVMTNLTQEHLDYHGTMEKYATAKARLFNVYLSPKHSVLNRDDDWFDYFKGQSVAPVVAYGQAKDSDNRIIDVQLAAKGTGFGIESQGKTANFTMPLIGLFNVYNAAAAISVAKLLGASDRQLQAGLEKVDIVPGRMEYIVAGQKFDVVVDFAVSPDALKKVLEAMKAITKGKVSIVFGATGDRDKSKRPVMGEVAAKLADRIFLTDDETYTEDPDTIRDAVYAGIQSAKGEAKTTVIPDRYEAITAAFKASKPGDSVILAGTGNENYRNMGGKPLPWDERDIARQILKSP